MLDWDRDLDGLTRTFGIEPAPAPANDLKPNGQPSLSLSLPMLDIARLTTQRRAATFEGFWRTTRPSIAMPGRFFHDHGIIRCGGDGLLQFKMGGSGLLFDGWLLPAEGQLFAILFDNVGQTPVFLIFNGVALHKATMLDGLVMAAALNAARTPSAYPIVMERIGDLTRDRATDDATCEELLARDTAAPEESISEAVRRHLTPDIGPAAVKAGIGDLFLLAPWGSSMSRGASAGGHLQG
jgi:hypothetical protein